MKTPLLDEHHTLAIADGVLVIKSMSSMPIRELVLNAFNKTKANEVQLHLGQGFRWDIEKEEIEHELFEEALFDMMDDADFPFDDQGEVHLHVRMIAVN